MRSGALGRVEMKKGQLSWEVYICFDTFHIKPGFYHLMFVFICVCGVCVSFYGCVHMNIWGHIHVYTHGSQGLIMSGVFLLTLLLGFLLDPRAHQFDQ